MPTINLTDDELAATAAAIRQTIADDRFPHAPRLDPLRAALGKFEAALKPEPAPKATPAGARRAPGRDMSEERILLKASGSSSRARIAASRARSSP